MFTEKNGIEGLLVGKRIIVFDQEANKVAIIKAKEYTWKVAKGNG